jgi:2-(1,2-epoxy-1,2-dihydrophenyl)acetyl-CoA isomerase
MTDVILYEVNEAVATITLNRPDKLNAFTDEMLYLLQDILKKAERDDTVRCLLITGAGHGFCSGQDLGEAQARADEGDDPNYGEHLRNTYNPIITRMTTMPKPIITAINGVAAGAGMSIALSGDYKIAAESASFIQAFVKIGLVPDSGSTWMLPRLIGYTKAMDLMLTGRKAKAQEALDIGMVNRVVANEQLMEEAHKLASQFAQAATKGIGYIKQAVNFASNNNLADALEYEAKMQTLAGHTDDHNEGLRSFLEKRQPTYKGK